MRVFFQIEIGRKHLSTDVQMSSFRHHMESGDHLETAQEGLAMIFSFVGIGVVSTATAVTCWMMTNTFDRYNNPMSNWAKLWVIRVFV